MHNIYANALYANDRLVKITLSSKPLKKKQAKCENCRSMMVAVREFINKREGELKND
jgi:hypothetical protein